MKLWCGFEDDNTLFGISDIPKLSFVKKWLPTYIHLLLTKKENEKDREKDKCLMEDLRSRCHKNWTRCAFQDGL